MTRSAHKLIPTDFSSTPSIAALDATEITVVDSVGDVATLGLVVDAAGTEPVAGFDRDRLKSLGFEAKPGQTFTVPTASGPNTVLLGAGETVTAAGLRDLAASFVRASAKHATLGLEIASLGDVSAAEAGPALAEGVLLARYSYAGRKTEPKTVALERVEIMTPGGDALASGIATGTITARATAIARDLINTPPGHLTAIDMADAAVALGETYGFDVEVFDKAALLELGTGGLLGVNAGSTEEPRMIKLSYTPDGDATGHLGLVGKGIMYDSGGLSLKPSDGMHALMKMDMGGAGAVLGAFTALRALGGTATVTGWLMCTDNMPSGSATKLGDVLTARGGTTIEVKNTDAEGRLVMADGLVLATEDNVDAIIDIATLTGAAVAALGPNTAAVLGNNDAFTAQVLEAAKTTDESLWQLPLEKKYRKYLDSDVADLCNISSMRYAGATTAALFLNEFVGETPWAHLDIAATMNADSDESWRSKGATGYGTRTIIDVARGFSSAE